MNYHQYYHSDERQAARGLMMVALGIVACCVPGGQGVGAAGMAGGVAKITGTVIKAGTRDSGRKTANGKLSIYRPLRRYRRFLKPHPTVPHPKHYPRLS
jgi:hypothetical protein